jgi:hypothetical protein
VDPRAVLEAVVKRHLVIAGNQTPVIQPEGSQILTKLSRFLVLTRYLHFRGSQVLYDLYYFGVLTSRRHRSGAWVCAHSQFMGLFFFRYKLNGS